MLFLTKPGDTSQTLACRILGNPNDSYAKKLREMNKNTLAYTSLESDYYLPDQLIWCPDFSELDNHPDTREIILAETQFIPSWGKANINKLQNQGADLNDLIAAAKVADNIEHNKSTHGTTVFSASMAGSWAAIKLAGKLLLRVTPLGRISLILFTTFEVISFTLTGKYIDEYIESIENFIEKKLKK